MNDAFGNPLAIEMSQFLDQMMVLDEYRTAGAAVCEFWLSATGAPLSVVRTFFPSMGISSSLFAVLRLNPILKYV
jgi:hypothetical protein